MRVIVSGALGRMGSEVAKAILAQPDMELVAGVEAHDRLREDPGFVLHPSVIGLSADVLADFTSASISLPILREAASSGMALVVGTTGFSPDQAEEIRSLSGKVPVLVSANMSLGIAILSGLVRQVAALVPDYDVEIAEIHHRGKKDSPSGTAKALFGAVKEARPQASMVTSRQGPRTEREVGVFGLRGGGVFGDHSVHFLGDGEIITLSHRALSRAAFAQGTLAAIRFIAGAKPGFYTMADVLGL